MTAVAATLPAPSDGGHRRFPRPHMTARVALSREERRALALIADRP